MRIRVTQEDLDIGKRYSAWNSPLAYAFMRKFNSKSVFVGRIICLDNGLRIELQDIGLAKQTAFDRGEKLEPFEIPVSAEAIYKSKIYKDNL